MAHKRKGILVKAQSRAKHLRNKRFFWKRHRMAEKQLIRKEIE